MLQIFSISAKTKAMLKELTGFFLWEGHLFRVNRSVCYLPIQRRGLSLKDLELQGEALLLQRTTKIICDCYDTRPGQRMMSVLNKIELTLPLDVQS